MATIKTIQKRIKSARSISKITKAMQMVAAAKMRKSQELAEKGKPYQKMIVDAVTELSEKIDVSIHPLLNSASPSGKTLIILISTNKGLCGGLNTMLFRSVYQWLGNKDKTAFVTIGNKGENFVLRRKNELIADFSDGDPLNNVSAITKLFIDGFLDGTYKNVVLAFNKFVSSLKQEPAIRQILPITLDSKQQEKEELSKFSEFLVEPSAMQVLESLLPHYIEIQVRTALLEAIASEHSARMIAMKNATDNARGLISDLTLAYNRLRQEKITYEISDIVTAKISMEE